MPTCACGRRFEPPEGARAAACPACGRTVAQGVEPASPAPAPPGPLALRDGPGPRRGRYDLRSPPGGRPAVGNVPLPPPLPSAGAAARPRPALPASLRPLRLASAAGLLAGLFILWRAIDFALAPRLLLKERFAARETRSIRSELVVRNGDGTRAGVVHRFTGGETAVFTLSITDADEAGPAEAEIRYEIQGERGTRLTAILNPIAQYLQPGPLHRAAVRLSRGGQGWGAVVKGGGEDAALAARLLASRPGLPYGFILPGRKVRRGAGWSLDPEEIRRLVIFPGAAVEGRWNLRLEEVHPEGGGRVGSIADRYDVTLAGADRLGPKRLRLKGQGIWTFSETLGRITGYEGTGELEAEEKNEVLKNVPSVNVVDRVRRGPYRWRIEVR